VGQRRLGCQAEEAVRIFVLDDDPERILWFMQQWAGEQFTCVNNAEDAVMLLRRFEVLPYDLMFLDHDLAGHVYLPSDEKSGYEVVKTLVTRGYPREMLAFVHSWNEAGSRLMVESLRAAGIRVKAAKFGTFEKGDIWTGSPS